MGVGWLVYIAIVSAFIGLSACAYGLEKYSVAQFFFIMAAFAAGTIIPISQ